MSMYSTSDISYYNSGEKLNGFTEYSETICVLENEQMTYRLIITTFILFLIFHSIGRNNYLVI